MFHEVYLLVCLCFDDKYNEKIKIFISNTLNYRIDFHEVHFSSVFKNKAESKEKDHHLEKYCDELVLRKKYTYSSYVNINKKVNDSEILTRKVKKLCHGVFLIFNYIKL